jgi:hypothetical protein
MAKMNPGFGVIEGGDEPAAPQPDPNAVAVAMITLGIKSLSQRALTAATDLFSLLTMASCFWLWSSIPAPNDRQIVSLALYGLLMLAINVIVRRK